MAHRLGEIMTDTEKANGVHSKEVYPEGKTTAERYANAIKINKNYIATDYTIDTKKRGKVKDITNGEPFVLDEPQLVD